MLNSSGIKDATTESDTEVKVYDAMRTVACDGLRSDVTVPQKGLYIISSSDSTEKVIM